MSFTKSLVPRSPSGINMIAEVDIFYPLQTKIADYYPKPPPPPPDEEEGEEEGEEEEELPVQPAPQPQPAPQQKPAPSDAPMARPKPPTAILQDGADNYNTQNHPGEIYVTGPPRRIASSEVLDNFVYRNPQYSHRNEIFWRPTKPVYPVGHRRDIFHYFMSHEHSNCFSYRCHQFAIPRRHSIEMVHRMFAHFQVVIWIRTICYSNI